MTTSCTDTIAGVTVARMQANFLVQAALQRIDAATTVTAGDTAAESTQQQQPQQLAAAMVAAVAALAPQLLAKRAGVLWRAAQACVRLSLSGESQDQFLQAVATAATAAAAAATAAAAAAAGDDAAAVESGSSSATAASALDASSDAFAAARVWVPAVLELALPGTKSISTTTAAGDAATDATAKKGKTAVVAEKVDKFREGKLYMDVTAGRLVENLLRFKRKLAAPVVKAVVSLPEQVCANEILLLLLLLMTMLFPLVAVLLL
jgi:hypothetical protein